VFCHYYAILSKFIDAPILLGPAGSVGKGGPPVIYRIPLDTFTIVITSPAIKDRVAIPTLIEVICGKLPSLAKNIGSSPGEPIPELEKVPSNLQLGTSVPFTKIAYTTVETAMVMLLW
jgi:hypothetical protein